MCPRKTKKVSNRRKRKNHRFLVIETQFVYCPLIWMLCFKTDIQRVEIQVVYNNYMATYDELLALDNKLKTHQKHLKFLDIEICKSKNKLNQSFMWKTYKGGNIPYSWRRGTSLTIRNVNTQKYGINSLNFKGRVFWNNIPIKFKKFKFLQKFKPLLEQNKNFRVPAQRVKHREFWLLVVLFLNFNIYV